MVWSPSLLFAAKIMARNVVFFALSFFELAFDVLKQTQGGHGISLSDPQTSRTPAAPARAPPRPGERGVTVWGGKSSISHSMVRERREK